MFRNLLIAVAIFGLGWGASFGAGAAYGRRTSPVAQAASVSAGQNAAGAAQGGAGAQGRGGAASGTVSQVNGKTLTVDGANGQQTKVNVTDQTKILKEDSGALSDLVAGTRVTVQPQGQPGADGALNAATIQIVPEGVAGALGQRGNAGTGGQQQRGNAGTGAAR